MAIDHTHLFLPYLKAVDVDVVLNVLKRAPKAVHAFSKCNQLWLKFIVLYEREIVYNSLLSWNTD